MHSDAIGREIRDLTTFPELLREDPTHAERLANVSARSSRSSSGFSRRGRRRKKRRGKKRRKRRRRSENKTIRAEKLHRTSPITLTGHALFINVDLFTAVTVRKGGKKIAHSCAAREGLNFAGFSPFALWGKF